MIYSKIYFKVHHEIKHAGDGQGTAQVLVKTHFFEFHLVILGSHSILYLKEESKFLEFSDFVYYSKISQQNGSDPFISEKKSPKISPKKCPKLDFQTNPAKFDINHDPYNPNNFFHLSKGSVKFQMNFKDPFGCSELSDF